MAYVLKRNILNIRNPNSGLFESVPMMVGESAYQIAVRHGYEGSEEDWIEHISGTSGGIITEALKAKKAGALDLSTAVGSDTEPVYFNADGKPVPCGVKLGSAAGYDVSDDLNESQTSVVTNIALKTLVNDTIPEMIQKKIDGLEITPGTSYSVEGTTLILS